MHEKEFQYNLCINQLLIRKVIQLLIDYKFHFEPSKCNDENYIVIRKFGKLNRELKWK